MGRQRKTIQFITDYSYTRPEWCPSSAPMLDPDCLLDRPTILYEEEDPARERKAIPLRLGKRDRVRLNEICENLGVTRSRFYRVITRIVHQEIVKADPESRLGKLLNRASQGEKSRSKQAPALR